MRDRRGMGLSQKAVRRTGDVFERAQLGDPRRVCRAVGLAEALARNPSQSLPKIWASSAELEAGYRFLRSPRTEFGELMEAVQHQARQAALREGRVLVLHDTTDVSCPSAEPEEVGFLQTGKPGFYVHHALCVGATEPHKPLGVLWSQLWGRAQRSKGKKRNRAGSELAKQKERESDRWLEGVTETQLWTQGCAEVVHVMDRESDSYRLFAHMSELRADFVVRLRHNRKVEQGKLSEALMNKPVKMTRLVPISARRKKTMPRYTHGGRQARQAELQVRAATVTIEPPRYLADQRPIKLHVVQLQESHCPEGQDPIQWTLGTTLPVRTKRDVERVIDIYRARWGIEEFHKALKTGCMLEKRQLESFESITTLLAISYPTACELLRVRSRSRDPNVKAREVFRQTMLDCLRAHPHARPLSANPTAKDVLYVIAGIGGHIKYNGPPGWQTLAKGYVEMLAFEAGWIAALEVRDL